MRSARLFIFPKPATTVFDGKRKKVKKASILSKFPRKPTMLEVAKNLKGAIVTASNNGNGKNSDTLKILNEDLAPFLQDIIIGNTKSYRYYFIEAPKEHHSFHFSEVYFLTSKELIRGTSKCAPSLPVIHKEQKIDTSLVEPVAENWTLKNNAKVQDGNLTTDLGGYSKINMAYKTPTVITHLRLAPLNENNGVKPGHEYSLKAWQNGQWEEIWTGVTQFSYIPCPALYTNQLYWLSDLTAGKEESPFTIDKKGRQKFVYEQ